jgi:polysaccharide biosynthesis protein PslE
MSSQQQILELYQFVRRAIDRHWRKGAAVTAVAAVVAVLGTLLMPRSYYSEARLFVRFGRENQVDPTASGGQMVSLYESRESEINSLIEILKSRAIFDRVVGELGPGFVLYGRQAKEEQTGQTGQPPTKAHQIAVARLIKTVAIAAPRKSNIITVACKANSPAMAQQIVAKLVEVYQDEHVRVHRSPGTYAFFEEQAEQSLTAWQKAADELRATKDRLGIVTIEGRRKHLDDTIAEINFKRLANQSETRTTQAKIASLQAEIASLSPTVVTQETTAASAAADGMRQTLFNLEAQEHDLSAKMQDNHPRLIAVRRQVAELREVVKQQPAEHVQATEAINPSRQSLELSLLTERSHAEALVAGQRALASQYEQLRVEMTELNAQAITVDELTQRVALAEANHKEYAQRLELARINRTLDEERLSSLSLVQPASYVAAASGPRRSLVLALGLFLAMLGGLGTILAVGWLNPLLETSQEIVALLGVPLVGAIPRNTLAAAA